MEYDRIEKIENSLIQHGKVSDRIYLMKLKDPPEKIIPRLNDLAASQNYTKIFAKIPATSGPAFCAHGYTEEARIPDFFTRGNDCLFMARFFDSTRKISSDQSKIEGILSQARDKAQDDAPPAQSFPFGIVKAAPGDAEHLSGLYRDVFESYPFPIHDPEYIRATMQSHIDYYLIRDRGRVVAASSAEKDRDSRTVEMTDFATHPEYRGKKFALNLLRFAEEDMRSENMRLGYTIARARSAGMNIVFAKNGYTCGGTLINNTCICGKIESMNVWYKNVPDTV